MIKSVFVAKPSYRKLRRAWRLSTGKPKTIEVNSTDELLACVYNTCQRPLSMNIRFDLIRMPGGRLLDASHPFAVSLLQGENALAAFYDRFQPSTLAAFYGLLPNGRLGENAEPWQQPWFWDGATQKPSGEKGLGLEHGESYYGPVTPQKLSLEVRRLREVYASIRSHGYIQGRLAAGVTGVVFKSKSAAALLITGGKHRCGALAALGETHIPVQFSMAMPRQVSAADAAHFPMVRAGRMDAGFCTEIVETICAGIAN